MTPFPRAFSSRRRQRTSADVDLRLVAAQLARLAAFFAGLGLALQLVRGDRWLMTAPFTFALPPLVIAVLLGAAAAGFWLARRPGWALAALAASLGVGVLGLALDYRPGECSPPADAGPRVATWNVGRRWSARMASRLGQLDADVVALTEAFRVPPDRWAAALPEHYLCASGWGILVLSRSPIHSCERHRLDGGSRAVLAVVERRPRLRVIAVDVDGELLGLRRRPLAAIADLARAGAGPTIVLGDFNTPRRAFGFDPLRRTHANAFALAGRGWAATWPTPAPVLDIDQVWLPRPVTAACARTLASADSDHRPLVVDLAPDGL